MIELGLDTFGDITVNSAGESEPHPVVLRDLVEQAVLADSLGIDVIGVGEHHRPDFAVSAPEVVLGAIAGRTQRIRLASAVTILSSDDPIRVFQRFATLDAVSNGRAEVILGRGSFIESFGLFGLDLSDYERLFTEKIDLFAQVRNEAPFSWAGTHRPPLADTRVFPTTESGSLTTWVGVGGTPESVVRAARYGFNLMLAIIGGEPARFAPYVDLYEQALAEYSQPRLPVGVHAPGYVGATDEQARDEYFPHYGAMVATIGRERGWPPLTRERFEAEAGPEGALFVGSPTTVAEKIVRTARTLRLQRFDLKYSSGTLPHELMMGCIQRYGAEVIPRVRAGLAEQE